MKQTGFAFTLACHSLMSCNPAQGAKPASKPALVTAAPDLTKLNIEKYCNRYRPPMFSRGPRTSPLQVVAEFSATAARPGERAGSNCCRRARQRLYALSNGASSTQQLAVLLNSGGNPAQVGILVIQIHALQQQMAQAQQAFSRNRGHPRR